MELLELTGQANITSPNKKRVELELVIWWQQQPRMTKRARSLHAPFAIVVIDHTGPVIHIVVKKDSKMGDMLLKKLKNHRSWTKVAPRGWIKRKNTTEHFVLKVHLFS